jgi:hypothetical protein
MEDGRERSGWLCWDYSSVTVMRRGSGDCLRISDGKCWCGPEHEASEMRIMDERGWTIGHAMDERIPEETASSLFIVVDRAGSVASLHKSISSCTKGCAVQDNIKRTIYFVQSISLGSYFMYNRTYIAYAKSQTHDQL